MSILKRILGPREKEGKVNEKDTNKKYHEPWNKGKKMSDECRKKMSQAQIGKKHSEETKQKIREKNKGYKPSEETKQKIRESCRKRYQERVQAIAEQKIQEEEEKKKLIEVYLQAKINDAIETERKQVETVYKKQIEEFIQAKVNEAVTEIMIKVIKDSTDKIKKNKTRKNKETLQKVSEVR